MIGIGGGAAEDNPQRTCRDRLTQRCKTAELTPKAPISGCMTNKTGFKRGFPPAQQVWKSMRRPEELTELIQSMSKSEKRYFKLFAGRLARVKSSKYLELFDLMARGDSA